MLGKLVITGADRDQALRRARRALAEFRIEGLATVLPFHRYVVEHPHFAPVDSGRPFTVHTRWIEEELAGALSEFPQQLMAETALSPSATSHRQVTVEVNGRRMQVTIPADFVSGSPDGPPVTPLVPSRLAANGSRARSSIASNGNGSPGADTDALVSPMQGTVVKVVVDEGQTVAKGDLLMVIEAMKMEQPVHAHKGGVVAGLDVRPGAVLAAGAVICVITPSGPVTMERED
jgi:acetyl-CoA/propionyl-CoA carboxylase biotin carboxyl carrier protein